MPTPANELAAAAVELLDSGEADTITEAAARMGAPRTTVSDHWRRHRNGDKKPIEVDDSLTDTPQLDEEAFPVIKRDYSDQSEMFVYPLGDVHKGSAMHDRKKWREWVKYVADTGNASMLGTGDFLNAALTTSVSDTYAETQTVQEAKWELAEELEPLGEDDGSDCLDLLIPGNHEARIHRATGDCPVYDIARHLNVPYSKTGALMVYQVGDIEYEVFVTHGTGGGQVGARAKRLAVKAETIWADAYITAHTHQQLVFPEMILKRDGDKLRRHKRLFISAGSFLAYEEYAAAMTYKPTAMGAPRLRLDGHEHKMNVSI